MKKSVVLIAGLLLTSCSAGSGSDDAVLEPLIDTAPGSQTLLESPDLVARNYEEVAASEDLVSEFVRDIEAGSALIDDRSPVIADYLVRRGFAWCEVMRAGATDKEIEARIKEAAIDQTDVNLDRATIVASAINFCPDQLFRFES